MNDLLNQNADQYNILIVDDTPESLEILGELLEQGGYGVRPAPNGRLALQSVAARLPDLILLDVKMPEMDGFEVCRRLKSDGHSRHVPVIFISAHGETANIVEGFEAGGVDYIAKPFQRKEVLSRVKIQLRLHELTEGLEQQVAQRTQALRASETRYRGLFEDSPISLWEEDFSEGRKYYDKLRASGVTDFRKYFREHPEEVAHCAGLVKVLDVNKATLDLFRAENKQELLSGLEKIFTPQSLEVFREEVITLFQGKHHYKGEVVQRTLTGKEIIAAIQFSVAQGYEESWGKVMVSLLDITESKKAEEALQKHREHLEELVKERTAELEIAKEQAEAANKAKSLFVANMGHEFRSPLNVIMGFSQLMRKEALSPTKKQEYLNIINRNCQNLLAQINDVLAISKIEAGQLGFEDVTFDLRAMFRDLKKAFESSVDDKGLFLKITGIDSLPRYVNTDKNKLRQVLANILGNAVKFTEKGGITVHAAVSDGPAGAMRLAVEVRDTGIGIAEDELDKVFDYFEQTADGRGQNNGTGLGLAISRDYLRVMDGNITVTSEPGKGSVFRFEIGIKKGVEKELKEQISERFVKGLLPGQKVPRVMVVEDKRDSRMLLTKILNTAGFEVSEAADGKEAVERFHQQRPGFIWMDIRMPVMDGLEATRRIKGTEAGKSTVVAALTAHALEEEREEILAAGCDDFVRKPFHENEIFEVMAKHLDLQYVYEDKQEEPVSGEPEVDIRPEQLAALTEELRSQLHNAVVELDKERILELAERIKPMDAPMARTLNACVQKFALSALLDQLEKTEGPENGGGP